MLGEFDGGPEFCKYGDTATSANRNAASPNCYTTGADSNATSSDGHTTRCARDPANITAKQPERIAERDFSGKHARIEFAGASDTRYEHIAVDGESKHNEQSGNYAERISMQHSAWKRSGHGRLDASGDTEPRIGARHKFRQFNFAKSQFDELGRQWCGNIADESGGVRIKRKRNNTVSACIIPEWNWERTTIEVGVLGVFLLL